MIDQKLNSSFKPGAIWEDTEGKGIQAHGGGIMYDRGVYYWFGEDKDGKTISGEQIVCGYRVDAIGVRCYSSTDLFNWKNEGLALSCFRDDIKHDLHPCKVVERPKVIYNNKTNKYVMWMHIDTHDYCTAKTGIAVSNNPSGPYEYIGSMRPNGFDSRDMTIFKDEDEKAYIIYSSEWNKTLYIAELTDDYLGTIGSYTKNLINMSREAPAVFKHGKKYFMITSGCTGWDSNSAEYAIADSIMGPWERKGNPCTGNNAEMTFYAQSAFVLAVTNTKNQYIFMADRWKKENLSDSRYVWLPIFVKDDNIEIKWFDLWNLSVYYD